MTTSSNHLENVDFLELLDRYNDLLVKYVSLSQELAPKLEKFGKYRKELQIISVEFARRGLKPEEPQALVKLMEAEIERAKNGVQEANTSKGNTEPRENSK